MTNKFGNRKLEEWVKIQNKHENKHRLNQIIAYNMTNNLVIENWKS